MSVSLAGFDLGEFDVDAAFADASDERVTAEICAEVPAALEYSGTVTPGLGAMSAAGSGEQEVQTPLAVQEETTGTELTIPVTVLGAAAALVLSILGGLLVLRSRRGRTG